MNVSKAKLTPPADDSRLERLVDGELERDEYRALLAALEEEPGGWKRCALAFLESQALAAELGSIRRSLPLGDLPATDLPNVNPAGVSSSTDSRKAWRAQVPSLAAIAASFLVMFSLAFVAWKFVSRTGQETPVAGNVLQQPSVAKPIHAEAPPGSPRRIGNVRLVMDGVEGASGGDGQVPVFETAGDIEELLAADRPALAPELIELLRLRGYDVRREQQYFPAPLEDGRQIIVPVEGYQITPVGRRY